MRRFIRRWWLAAAVLAVVLGVMVALGYPQQRICPLNAGATVLPAGRRPPAGTPLGADRLVLLDVDDFGYASYARLGADELAYEAIYVEGGTPYRLPHCDSRLVIRGLTKAAINLREASSVFNAAARPLLVDELPWAYTSRGPAAGWNIHSALPWLRHRSAVTAVAADGTVTVEAGDRCIALRPAGKVKLVRSLALWGSSVTIRHRGVFEKRKIRQSKWLVVETDRDKVRDEESGVLRRRSGCRPSLAQDDNEEGVGLGPRPPEI